MENLFEKKWTVDMEDVLKRISHNAGLISEEHRLRYNALNEQLKWYKIPVIVLSGINSVFSVGLTSYMEQNIISTLTCLISLSVGIISSIELYLSIQKRSEQEIQTYKSFYLLSVKINACLALETQNRMTDGDTFLTQMISEYESLFETALVNGLRENDKLVELIIK
jgi:hypothetical protein